MKQPEPEFDTPWGAVVAVVSLLGGGAVAGWHAVRRMLKRRRAFRFQHAMLLQAWCKQHGIPYDEKALEVDNFGDFYALMRSLGKKEEDA